LRGEGAVRQWGRGAVVLLAACVPTLPPLPIPVGLAESSIEAAASWSDSTRPVGYRDIRFRFQFRDENGSGGGRGRARLAAPDSIRFDLAGPLGAFRASAFVVGDSAIWTDSEDQIRKLVPSYPLFWAMLGIVLRPDPGSRVRGLADSQITAWQFSVDRDTVEYVREFGARPRLLAEVRQAGKVVGRVETKFGPDGPPISSRLTVPRPAARLDLTFSQNASAVPFAPETWHFPTPPGDR